MMDAVPLRGLWPQLSDVFFVLSDRFRPSSPAFVRCFWRELQDKCGLKGCRGHGFKPMADTAARFGDDVFTG